MILNHISVDCVIFGFNNDKLNVLLWQAIPELLRKFLNTNDEYEQIRVLFDENPALKSDNSWGLIGSHLTAEDDLDFFAKKNLSTATGLDNVYLKQVMTFGSPNRIPHFRELTVVLNKKLDTRKFRKKIMKMGLLNEIMEKQENVAHRAARLYSFDMNIYNKLVEEGLNFRI